MKAPKHVRIGNKNLVEMLSVSTVILGHDHRQIIFEWNSIAIIVLLSLNASNVFTKPPKPISDYLSNNF